MASSATPMGAEPVGCISSGGSFTGKVRHYKIASNYGTAIFYGSTSSSSCVFVGVSYTDPNTNQKTFSQTYPASTVASDISAYVVDDPYLEMQMQGDASLAQTTLGNNVAVVQTAGSTTIGRSKNAVDSSTAATTNTLPLRIMEFVDGPDSSVGDSFTDVIVKFNAGHQLDNTTGV